MNAELKAALGPDALPWLLAAAGMLLAAATLEGLVTSLWLRRDYDWRAFGASLGDAIGRRAVDALGLSLAAPVIAWAWQHRVADIDLGVPGMLALLFLGQEFCYYWMHRASHRVRWFWATHAVHHSPNQLTLAAALCLGWTGKLTGTALFFVPLVWLGFPPLAVAGAVAANLAWQFWLHATWIPKLGPLEWIFNTPSHHRVHHASNAEYIDCNFGGVLIVFDRLFGTCVEERADIAPRYGLAAPLHSHHPVVIAFHEWRRLLRDLVTAPDWRGRWRAVAGPPP